MEQDYFRIFTNCRISKGFTRSIIADTQRQHAEFIPNSLAEVIEKLNRKASLSSLYKEYGADNAEALTEYLTFLEKEQYGFYCSREEFDLFPEMDLAYHNPSLLTNIIIEFSPEQLSSLPTIVQQLDLLGCKDVALVCYDSLTAADFAFIGRCFDHSIVKSVELISKYSDLASESFLSKTSMTFERLTSLVFHSAPEHREISWDNTILCDVSFTTVEFKSFSFCGGVNLEYFNVNLPKVLEATNHNSCLHKKIAIDIQGNIKNCPAMSHSYGNIKEVSLGEALNHPSFKQYWNLTKDHTEVCKDCEFRIICTDCRAYTQGTHTNENGLDSSKPLKCGYDPYTGTWQVGA